MEIGNGEMYPLTAYPTCVCLSSGQLLAPSL